MSHISYRTTVVLIDDYGSDWLLSTNNDVRQGREDQ
jgi:hypothetical protein